MNQPPDASEHRRRFGEWISAAIKAAGYSSPSALAHELGSDPSVVIRWTKGKTVPGAETIPRLVPLLHVSENELLTRAYVEADEPKSNLPAPRKMHRWAVLLDQLLADDSPLSDAEREALDLMMESILPRFASGEIRAGGIRKPQPRRRSE